MLLVPRIFRAPLFANILRDVDAIEPGPVSPRSPSRFRSGALRRLQRPDALLGVVGDAEYVEVVDLGLDAVALDDALAPGSGIEGLGVLPGLPLIDAARVAVLAPDEVLADEPRNVAEAWRDLGVVGAAGGAVDEPRVRLRCLLPDACSLHGES